jgi:hypothetical protein
MTRRLCLGFAAGAFFFGLPALVSSQVVVPPASEVPVPPKPPTDSTIRADSVRVRTDTLQASFGRDVGPRTADIGPQYEWDRQQLFASGAYTVADLLERVPGTTSIRSGWLMSPKFVGVNGDLSRIRIFYDGLEMDNLDRRTPILDLTTVELWTLENLLIERGANEIRVHLRSWKVDRTNPYTRADIYTGDEDTNIYRGYYGKRFFNGAALQLAGQQFNTRAARLGGGGDALSFLGRYGVARRMWSVDAVFHRRNASRTTQPTFGQGLSIQPFEGTTTLAYLRAGIGDQSGGPWAQAIASYMRLGETSAHITPAEALSNRLLPDTVDSTTHRAQYVLSAGYSRGVLRASVADRIRAYDGEIRQAPNARLEVATAYGIVSLFGERDVFAKRTRGDAVARLTPLPFIAFAGAASYDAPDNEVEDLQSGFPSSSSQMPRAVSFRAEAGVRLFRPWLSAGLISRDTAILVPPSMFDTAYTYVSLGKRQGLFAALRGPVYGDVNVDAVATRWDSAGLYQPRYQSRSELNLDTRWLSRFPSGNFGLKVAFIHEYRGEVDFPTTTGLRTAASSNVIGALLEIRIMRGVATYQVRNMLGYNYQIVPDFYMPRAISIYGLRWEFWN